MGSQTHNHKKPTSAIKEFISEGEKHTQKFRQAAHSILHKEGVQVEAIEREGLVARLACLLRKLGC